jgi:hypothetical protein
MTSNLAEDLAGLLRHAEQILGATLASPVRLGNAQRLSQSERRNLLIRCAVMGTQTGVPASVIIKRAGGGGGDYDPENPRSRAALGLLRDWAGLVFLNALAPDSAACPKFYGGDRAAGFFIMEDVGAGARSLDHVLTCGCRSEAEDALQRLARMLGQMHAVTAGREEQYQQIRDALGPGDRGRRPALAGHVRHAAPMLAQWCRDLGVNVAEGFDDDAETIATAMAEPGLFLAFTHGDPCPDNCIVSADRLHLIDFEFAGFRHALLDGVYGRLRFPTCSCVRDIPEPIVSEMEVAYREELAEGCAAARDDASYSRAVADACAYWLFENLAHLLPRAMQSEQLIGLATNRQRLLTRLGAFDRVAERSGHIEGLRRTLRQLLETLIDRWRASMPLYDAFRS